MNLLPPVVLAAPPHPGSSWDGSSPEGRATCPGPHGDMSESKSGMLGTVSMRRGCLGPSLHFGCSSTCCPGVAGAVRAPPPPPQRRLTTQWACLWAERAPRRNGCIGFGFLPAPRLPGPAGVSPVAASLFSVGKALLFLPPSGTGGASDAARKNSRQGSYGPWSLWHQELVGGSGSVA